MLPIPEISDSQDQRQTSRVTTIGVCDLADSAIDKDNIARALIGHFSMMCFFVVFAVL